MSKPSYDFKLPSRSIYEVKYALEDVIGRADRRRLKFLNRAVSGEAVLNAVVLHFLGLSAAEQDRIVDEFVPRFEALARTSVGETGPVTSADVKVTRPDTEGEKRREAGGT